MALAITHKARGFAFLSGGAATILVGYLLPRYAILDGTFSLRNAVLICATTYLVCGITLGFVWPNQGWRLGLWITAGNWALGAFAVLFEPPPMGVFIANDLPIMLTVVVAAFLGAFIGGYLGNQT